ncbi:MAG: ABC transporter substrate-binding protein [Bacteroidota bacterium]
MKYLDQLNRTIHLSGAPQRIVSLVPSQTELLIDLGLEDRLVGITKFCIHPKRLRSTKQVVGGTKNLRLEEIFNLQPDLIIGNKEENEQETIHSLAKDFPVWLSDISNREDALAMIAGLGQVTQTEKRADNLIQKIRLSFDKPLFRKKGKAVYLIWKGPIMAAGADTFISSMMDSAGFYNMIEQKRYPSLSEEDLIEYSPEFLLLSSEPFPFGPKELQHFQEILPQTKIVLVNGEYFSWYGSRMLDAMAYFKKLSKEL